MVEVKKKEDCSEDFNKTLRKSLGCPKELEDDWVDTATMIKETGKRVVGVCPTQ